MLQQRTTRLTAKAAALLAALPLALAPPSLGACQCGFPVAPSTPVCCQALEPTCCCAGLCGDSAGKCCCSQEAPAPGSDDTACSCSLTSQHPPAPAPTAPVRIDDLSSVGLTLPAIQTTNSPLSGLGHVAGGQSLVSAPPGIRLHALFSVWRN